MQVKETGKNERVYRFKPSDIIDDEGILTVKIPEGVTSIGNFAVWGYSDLEKIIMPNSVTSIGTSAFSGCESLLEINLPINITDIGKDAFYKCKSLTVINMLSRVSKIRKNTFKGCNRLEEINIPDSVLCIYDSAFSCSGLTQIIIPNSIVYIGDSAFFGCRELEEITILSSEILTKNIKKDAFGKCPSLKKIYVTESLYKRIARNYDKICKKWGLNENVEISIFQEKELESDKVSDDRSISEETKSQTTTENDIKESLCNPAPLLFNEESIFAKVSIRSEEPKPLQANEFQKNLDEH